MGEKKRTLRGFLCAALGGVCWGASGTVGQYLFTCQGVDSGWLTVVRMFLAGAVLLGGALALAGFLLQTFFNNPIAGPYILGISSGAKFVVALVMISSWGRRCR